MRMQRNRDPEEQVGWNVIRVSGEGETDGEAASVIRAQLPALICTKFSQLQFPNLSGKKVKVLPSSAGRMFFTKESHLLRGRKKTGDAVSQQSAG